MSDEKNRLPDHVPTLTEVVSESQRVMAAARSEHEAALDEEQIVNRVLAELQRRIDQMLEYRLREALAPALARAADALVVEARNDLAKTLRDVLARAVTQAVAQRRPR